MKREEILEDVIFFLVAVLVMWGMESWLWKSVDLFTYVIETGGWLLLGFVCGVCLRKLNERRKKI